MNYSNLSSVSGKKNKFKNHLDRRPVSWGLARIIMVLLVLLSILVLGREFFLFHATTDIPYSILNLWAASMWVPITAGVIHNGRKMRLLASFSILIETLLVLMVPLVRDEVAEAHLLTRFGATYFFLPSIMLLFTAIWLIWSSPFRQKRNLDFKPDKDD